MHTRVDRSEGPSYARPPPKKWVSINHKTRKKTQAFAHVYAYGAICCNIHDVNHYVNLC